MFPSGWQGKQSGMEKMNMNKIKTIAVFLAFFAVVTCDGGGLTDSRDGKKYKVVKIGIQTWMAENLNYAADGSKCYDNNPTNCDKYGRLYNWETAKKACPSGWHLPSNEEWETLQKFVDPSCDIVLCPDAGTKLKAKSGWKDYDPCVQRIGGVYATIEEGCKKATQSGNGTDKFGFSALPGGYVSSNDGNFYNVGSDGYWWSWNATGRVWADVAESVSISYNNDDGYGQGRDYKDNLFSVRCLQGPEIERKSVGNKETQTETMKRSIQSNDRTSPAGQKKSTKARKKAVDGIDSEQLQYWMENTEEE